MLSMLVTRPEPDASETAARLAALDIGAVKAPLLNFTPLPTTLPDAKGFAALAATSANALRALHDRGEIPHFRHLPLYAVGERTAAAARDFGFGEIVSADGDLAALVNLLADAGLAGPILYPAARDQSGDLARALAPYGVMVITAPVYAMSPTESIDDAILSALDGGAIAGALFYSRRTAQTFVSLADSRLGKAAHRKLGVLCLSEAVAAPLVDAHFVRVGLADHPSEEAMMTLALSFARDQNPA
ncbi:MAG TPA: uroporphyrinogen-III synthase [Devosia sp.]|nr:uroporphyrinogen-III synthase [Devosia sp.]